MPVVESTKWKRLDKLNRILCTWEGVEKERSVVKIDCVQKPSLCHA